MTSQDLFSILEIASPVSFGILIGMVCAYEYYKDEIEID